MRWTDCCCVGSCCFCIFTFISGFITLIVWSSIAYKYEPRFFIEDFYVPNLNVTDNNSTSSSAPTNHSLYFDLRLKNRNLFDPVRYSDTNISFFYRQNSSLIIPIGNYTFPKFKQGQGKTAHRKALVETYGMPWEAAYATVLNGSTVTFRVGLSTWAIYNYCTEDNCYDRAFVLVEAADVGVDGSGRKVNKHGIRLITTSRVVKYISATPPARTPHPFLLMGLPVMLSVLLFNT
ncbi:OLC1v1022832C1 [Oldenlandia corymbosa var. corymbosa]|uniref:OLC1v1022832C1 n=1 Tax=Oldenlandia corymbosa var. corymbosa TaxID=529605 RepID=A0AAV1BYS0_OLDCO|nr:OLC1v1022832C1 [Oldenlandia corymbosa var. corymbosa]